MQIVGTLFTALGYISYWAGRFFKKKSILMLANSLSSLFLMISHYCFGFYSAMASSVLVVLRGLAVNLKDRRSKPMIWLYILFMLAFTTVAIFLWEGWPTICFVICMYINMTANWFFSAQQIRMATPIASVFYMISLLLVGNYAGMLLESTIIICNVVSYIKYRKVYV